MRDDAVRLANIANRLGVANRAREEFEGFIHGIGTPSDVPGSLSAGGGRITVQCFGQTLTATARAVHTDGDVAVEYTFAGEDAAGAVPVWQFYLVPSMEKSFMARKPSFRTLEGGDRIGDWDNPHAAKHIILKVAEALLQSPLMAPLPFTAPVPL